jgi:pantetheine-phosphate adenylyltransferase
VDAAGRIVLGGTFDRLHVGHEALLTTAFRAGPRVAIGLTTSEFLAEHPKPAAATIQSFGVRRRRLAAWLERHYARRRWTIRPISDAFGGSVGPGVLGLVVSADTAEGGRAVNAERVRRGLRPVPVLVVPLVLADDLRPVSSRRVRSGEIDRNGRRLSEIRIRLRGLDPAERAPVQRAVRRAFPQARFAAGRRAPEIDISVRRVGRAGRSIRVRSASVTLPAVRVPPGGPRALARTLERLLRRSRPTNRLKREPR